MVIKRKALLRIAGGAVGVAALAGGLATAALPAHAATVVTTDLTWCDSISNTSVAVDAWSGTNFFGTADHNECHSTTAVSSGPATMEFFLDGQTSAVEIGSVTLDGSPLHVTFTGTVGDISESVS